MIRLLLRVDVQDDRRDVALVGAFRVGIEHAELGDGLLHVVCGERWTGRRESGGQGLVTDPRLKGERYVKRMFR